jgi:hypothetical protein
MRKRRENIRRGHFRRDVVRSLLRLGRSMDQIHNCEDEMISPGINPDYWKRAIKQAEKTQIVSDDIPPVESVFELKSGVRAKLVDRSGSMVIVEVEKYRSDWTEWSEVKARIAASDT